MAYEIQIPNGIDLEGGRILNQNIKNIVTVESIGGNFTSITDALDSITDNSSTNPYLIKVGVGVFTTTLIDLSSKPYVSLEGSSINTTIVEASASDHHIIKLGVYNEVSFITLSGSGTGFAGLYTNNGGVFSQAHKVSIYDCDICVLAENTTTASQLYLEYIDFGGVFSYGIKIVNTGAGINFVNAENQYGFPTSGLTTMFHIEGANAYFELNGSGNEPNTTQGNGIVIHSGAHTNIFSTYFNKFTTAISMPNTGTTPTAFFMATKTQDCTTDISIVHPSGQGSFSGSMNAPVISIVSTSNFGITYLENLLGNKHEQFYDPYAISPVAATSPTVSACTTVVQSSVTGLVSLQYSGSADQNASMNFRVPSDYLRGGRFKIIWSTSATSANTIYLAPILSLFNTGASLEVQTESLTPQIIVAGTVNLKQETGFFTPSTPFLIGQTGVLRISRLATNVNDTFTGSIFISGVYFEYESSK